MTKKQFADGWKHFCKCIDFGCSALDAEASKFMNEMPQAVGALFNKPETDIEKVLGFDVCAELRRLAQKQRDHVAKHPKLECVLLPACKASDWFLDEHEQQVGQHFEPVSLSGLLQFLADMIA